MLNATSLNVGLIGLGRMGTIHWSKLKSNSRVAKVFVYDPRTDQSLNQSPQTVYLDSLPKVLKHSDIVFVCSNTSSHFEISQQVINAGKPVFIEKPVSFSVSEVETLLELAIQNKVHLQVGFIEKVRAQKLLEGFSYSELLSLELVRFAAQPSREPNLDIVWDLLIHDLDLAYFLSAGKPTELSFKSKAFGSKTNNWVEGVGRWSDTLVSFKTHYMNPKPERKAILTTSQQRIILDLTSNQIETLDLYHKSQSQSKSSFDAVEEVHRCFFDNCTYPLSGSVAENILSVHQLAYEITLGKYSF